MSTPTAVLVHGAWYGPWAWDDVRSRLASVGVPSVTFPLSSTGDTLGGLTDDVAALRLALHEAEGPLGLIGHSYGGLPVTEVAAARDDVVHVVYVCALAIPVGTTLIDAVGGRRIARACPARLIGGNPMEFLVRTENRLPVETPEQTREQLRQGERERAQQLRAEGTLKRLWRVPGRNATVGLYEAEDPAALHDALTSLPMWKWMDVTVEALATHPQERK